MWQQAAIRVRAATGNGYQGTDMMQDAANEVGAELAQISTFVGIIEQVFACVFAACGAPEAEVDMGPTTGLIQEGFGRECGEQVKGAGDAAHSFAHQADVVGGP